MKKLLTLVLILTNSIILKCQNPAHSHKMDWFESARLGVFIHWGIYSVNGVSESWSFHNGRIKHTDYMDQVFRFTASKYRPEKWVELIAGSGARYAVITSKHHDGVSLWNTKANNLSIPMLSPAGRDVLTPFVDALRKSDLKAGVYFSLIDWTDNNYPGFLRDQNRYDLKTEPLRWKNYLNFMNTQIDEIAYQFNPDLWWFDGDWEHSAEEWGAAVIRQKLLAYNPNAIINGRLAGHGDYDTPEQHIPVQKPANKAWEICMTMNRSWGYQPADTAYKTPLEIITILSEVAGMGGNLLLGIGPKEDGTIPAEQVKILIELGRWNRKHSQAVFDTRQGLPLGHFHGPSTLSADSANLFLFLQGNPSEIVIKGLKNKIIKASVLGTQSQLTPKIVGDISWSPVPGLVFLKIPVELNDEYLTVVKIELDGPLRLYRGKGGFYE